MAISISADASWRCHSFSGFIATGFPEGQMAIRSQAGAVVDGANFLTMGGSTTSRDHVQTGHEIGVLPDGVKVRLLIDKFAVLRIQVKCIG